MHVPSEHMNSSEEHTQNAQFSNDIYVYSMILHQHKWEQRPTKYITIADQSISLGRLPSESEDFYVKMYTFNNTLPNGSKQHSDIMLKP